MSVLAGVVLCATAAIISRISPLLSAILMRFMLSNPVLPAPKEPAKSMSSGKHVVLWTNHVWPLS